MGRKAAEYEGVILEASSAMVHVADEEDYQCTSHREKATLSMDQNKCV